MLPTMSGSESAMQPKTKNVAFAPWLRKLQSQGYRVHIMFLALRSADLAVARVAERVRRGGHDVPEPVVRRRFVLGLENLITLFQPFVDSWQVLDNADLSGPRLVARGGCSDLPAARRLPWWSRWGRRFLVPHDQA